MRRLALASLAVGAVVLVAACNAQVQFDDGSSASFACPSAPTAAPSTAVSGTCTYGFTPKPTTTAPSTTTTAPPTSTTTPPPTTTTTSPPPPGGFPTPSTTGLPAGTTLQPAVTNLTISKAGTYSNLHVTQAVTVTVPGVHIVNSLIEGIGVDANEALDNETTAMNVDPSQRLTITDTTVGNSASCSPQPGVGEHDYTATRVKIIGMGDGFRVSGNYVTIQDSFVQACNDPNNHDDGVQVYCPAEFLTQPCHDVMVNHNTLSVALTRNFTAPVFGGSDPGGSNGQLANSSFTNNMLWGGVFSIYTMGKNITITGNRVATNRWTMPDGSACEGGTTGVNTAQGCSYAGWVYASSDVTQNGAARCSGITWSDNRAVTKDSNWQVAADNGALNCA